MKTKEQVLQKMKEDIQFRGLAENTVVSYTRSGRAFLDYCNRPVERLNEQDIRKFLSYLINEKNASPKTVNSYSGAIRFLFAVTLNRTLNYLQIPRMKNPKTLPEVLSREEILSLIENCQNIKHKALLMIIYGGGLRVSEAAALKIEHIDSKNMRVFIASGKGGKDRYTLLSEDGLGILRKYWLKYRPNHPEGWLFPGIYNVTHITSDAIEVAFKNAVKRANITKKVSVHTLRHSFATHALEDGFTLLQIKELLGHACVRSTTVYLHLANVTNGLKSPLDNFQAYIKDPLWLSDGEQ